MSWSRAKHEYRRKKRQVCLRLLCGRHRRTIDFAYDADKDTPEEVADEITNEFELSSTDRDICAAALKVRVLFI